MKTAILPAAPGAFLCEVYWDYGDETGDFVNATKDAIIGWCVANKLSEPSVPVTINGYVFRRTDLRHEDYHQRHIWVLTVDGKEFRDFGGGDNYVYNSLEEVKARLRENKGRGGVRTRTD